MNLTFPVELAVLAAQLHQLLVIAEQALGFVLNDVGIKESHSLPCRSIERNSADFLCSMAVRFYAMPTIALALNIVSVEPHRPAAGHA